MTKRYTRRKFLALGGAGGTALAAGIVPAPAATPSVAAAPSPAPLPAEPRTPAPLAELVPEDVLPIARVDVDATNRAGSLITVPVRGGDARRGGIILFPDASEILINRIMPRRTAFHHDPGNRTILRAEGRATIIKKPGVGGSLVGLEVKNRLPSSLEIEGLTCDMGGHTGSNCVLPLDVRYLRIKDCDLRGGANTLGLFTYPTIIEASGTEFSRGGRDDRKHVIYISYCERGTFTNCHFHSPRSRSHVVKFYGRHLDMRDCLIETYDDDPGFIHPRYKGWLMDIGAWGDTILVGNTIINKTSSRNTLVYRNRQYPEATPKFKGYGTSLVDDYHLVDNTDDANPHLFKHILMDNSFGHEGADISGTVGVRNSGTAEWQWPGSTNPLSLRKRPQDWQEKYQRSVVYAVNNRFTPYYGVGYSGKSITDHSVSAPIRRLSRPPAWFTG